MQIRYDKKILVVTHQLSLTGAPLVLLDMIDVCREQGYRIQVISLAEGELRGALEERGIPVEIQKNFLEDAGRFLEQAEQCDLVIVNTLVAAGAIHLLNGTKKPVLWWLHEGKQYFEYLSEALPKWSELKSNVHVFAVGHYVQDVIRERYQCETELLHFGVKDVPRSNAASPKRQKARFLTVGLYSRVKAQDVLARAVRMLPQDMLAQAEFYFCGNQEYYEEEIYRAVERLEVEYENVHILPQMPHDQMLLEMERADCLIVPSRVEPMPTVAVEMMMKEGMCLLTDICGVAHYVKDGVSGYLVPSEDAQALADKICHVVRHREEWERICREGRKIYEAYFSMDVFQPRVLELVESYVYPGEENMRQLALQIRQLQREIGLGLVLSAEDERQLENLIAMVQHYVDQNYISDKKGLWPWDGEEEKNVEY